MKPEVINQMLNEFHSCDSQLVEISKEWQQVEKNWHDAISDWEQRVIAIGQALIESKTEYGKGWKANFPSLGFECSYVVARRYMACAEHPDARGEANSVEDWAKAAADRIREANNAESAKEAARKKRAQSRKENEAKSSDNLGAFEQKDSEVTRTLTERADHRHLKSAVHSCCLQDEMQESFDLLPAAMVTDPRLVKLRPHWILLLEGLAQGMLPHIRAVSPSSESDDTVDSGGIDLSINRETEVLNA